ncbi:MAG: CPBP family intramembrane metalloprotease [Planctomycetes bacterium]|nr:CPBP family intramembrane metalloprotease [Planctomycetota bacterium]
MEPDLNHAPSRTGLAGAAWLVFRKEIVETLRDRRTLALAVGVPVLLYPLLAASLLLGSRDPWGDEALRVGLSAGSGRLRARLEAARLEPVEAPFLEEELREGRLAAHLELRGQEGAEGVTLRFASTSPRSREARRRVEEALEAHRSDLVKERFEARGVALDPSRAVAVEPADVASDRERGRARLALVLPVLLVVILLAGGSLAALDLVAGEKERGTLETLLVHPVPREGIVFGKFLVVLAASVLALLFHAGGLLGSLELARAAGLDPTAGGLELRHVPPAVLAVAPVLALPLAVLTSAVLLAVSAYARSFREAQTYVFPLTLAGLVLAGLALLPQATLSGVLAFVPVTGPALALREALEGTLAPVPFLAALLAAFAHALAALLGAARLLRREDLVLGLELPPLLGEARAEARARRAFLFAPLYLLAFYLAGGWLQAPGRVLEGLAVTLWGLVLVPALVYPVAVKAPFRETLGLVRPSWASLAAVPLLVASAVVLVAAYTQVQNLFLPVPRKMEELFREILLAQDLSPLAAALLLAVSPGVCEELLWRGAFQGELEPRGRPLRTAAAVGLFFGAFHFSVHRLVPTALLGAALAGLRHRSRSVIPCVLAHVLYNGLLLLAGPRLDGERLRSLLEPWLLLAASAGLAAALWLAGLGGRGSTPGCTRL